MSIWIGRLRLFYNICFHWFNCFLLAGEALPSSCPKLLQNPYLFTTVQPSGMPLMPVGIWPASEPCIKLAALVNVPDEATPDTQSRKQPTFAGIFVASIVMLLRFVQP